uniref:NADH-ubiquinone oxidoreductase chain 4 n=1 Tax=Choroterpides apiculata (nomen nudum) TaxID=2729127 RepID=A0A6M3R9X8_9DIPT|nr:NADH dehydrogenase subunit 4 [Choroterpides apiculata (nomen nudum)]
MLSSIFMMLGMILLLFYNQVWHFMMIMLFIYLMFVMIHMPMMTYSYLGYGFGMDLISYGLVMLSIWICSLMILASQSVYKTKFYFKAFIFMVMFLLIMLILTFMTLNLFMFYIYFESSLIPTLFLILGWGYQPERVQAGMYLLFYTLLASLPLLIGIFYLDMLNYSLSFIMLKGEILVSNLLLYLMMIMAFLVKMPMFLAHLWLPKAHVEAPVSGSMILAGVLLKLGGYGLMRVFSFSYMSGVMFNFMWVGISLIGGCLVSLICMRQTDLKALVAYSSIAHMGLVLGGMMTMNYWGMCGAYTLMIAHGLCSSGLFCLTNITYERLGSRSLMINKGLMNLMPSMALWWFLLSSANMAAPPTINLLGEISLLNSLLSWSWGCMITLALISFLSAGYTLYLFSFSQHGKFYSGVYNLVSGNIREYLLLMLHWLPLNILVMKGEMIYLWV